MEEEEFDGKKTDQPFKENTDDADLHEGGLHSTFKKISDEIETLIDSELDNTEKIATLNDIFSSINIPYMNKNPSNEFLNILEELRKNKKLEKFLEIFQKSKVKNMNMKSIVFHAFLSELNILSSTKQEKASLILLKYIVANFIYVLSPKQLNSLTHFLTQKVKSDSQYIDNLVSMLEKNKNIYTIFIAGLILMISDKDLKEETRKTISKTFVDYLIENVFDDEEGKKEKNIVTLRHLVRFFSHITPKYFYEDIIDKCKSLLNRSSKNAVFVYTIITYGNTDMTYNDEFCKKFFEEFSSCYFPSDNKIVQCTESFKIFARSANRKILFDELNNKNFSVDKYKLYNYSISYMVTLFDIKNDKKNNNTFSKDEVLKGALFILKNFKNAFDESHKEFYEVLFEKFVKSMISIKPTTEESSSDVSSELSDIISNIIRSTEYSNYHSYMYSLASILINRFNITLDSLSSQVESGIKNIGGEINQTSARNFLPLTSLAVLLGISCDNAIKTISSSKYFEKNLELLSDNDAISIYFVVKHLIAKKESDELVNSYIKLLSKLIFRVKKSTSELIVYEETVSVLLNEEKASYDFLNQVFLFILASKTDVSLPKMSFGRVSYFIYNFTMKFIEKLDDKNFIKVLILIHIPQMFLDTNINNKRPHSKNMFIAKIYKELKEKIIPKIENSIGLISSFVFSNLGLFNKENIAIENSCYSIINKIFEETTVSEFLLKESFGKLQEKKFKYVNSIIEFYNKQVDYISYYDLEDLVKVLKDNESKYAQTFSFVEPEEKEEEKEEPVPPKGNKKNQKKNANKNQKKPQQQQKKKEEPKDKDQRFAEYKSFLIMFCYNLSSNLMFTLNRLNPIVSLLLNDKLFNVKKNIKLTFERLWHLLPEKFCTGLLKKMIHSYFKANPLTNFLAFEFTHLMHLEANPNNVPLLNETIEKYPSLISKFNSKLNEALVTYDQKTEKLFNHFDFIIIRILFYIVLNKNIGIEDTVLSVDNLIQILTKSSSLDYSDLLDLLISLLKSNYTGNNLLQLLELYFKNADEKDFAIIANNLLEYEYISKLSFMKAVYDLDMKVIRKYQVLHYKVFILTFEENEMLSEIATKIWEKYALSVDHDFLKSKDFALGMTDHKERDVINKAVCGFAHKFPETVHQILEKYENFYREELELLQQKKKKKKEKEDEEEEEEEEEEEDEDTYLHKRDILLNFINGTLELLNSNEKKSVLDFLMKVADNEFEDSIFEKINNTIFKIINSIPEKEVVENILLSIESNLNDISKRNENEINYNNLKIILMMLNSILVRILGDGKFNSKKEILFDTLYLLAKKITKREILYLLFKNFEYISKDIRSKTLTIMDDIIQTLDSTRDKLCNLGDIYTLAGLVKCFGIVTYKAKKIEEIILSKMDGKSKVENKQNALYMVNIFFETLKKLYEPYFVDIFPKICTLIGDRENKVRETAQQCLKGMMKELSGYGAKKIMPSLVTDLHKMNWKSKVANIEILGQFAFCAPQILTVYIPKVIKEIMQVLKDPHTKVQETAVSVLKDIASAIKNPEIVDISEILVDAIANPSENSHNALSALLETEFRHYLDPPSLALIIPILDYNLKTQNDELKKKASHIIGSIQMIISNHDDLKQYNDIIIPNLKSALFDGSPECRNTIAKAIGSLTKSLGPEYFEEMMKYITSFLESESDTVQRSGAAQAYAEVMVAFGEAYIDQQLLKLISKIQGGNSVSKEGYLSVFVFLPGCLGDKFEKYFGLIFPLIIEAFSDESGDVRNVSNKIFEICIKLYAKKNTEELLTPLLVRLFEPNWRIRNSSIALIKTLIMNLNNEFFRESSEYFKKELRDQILTYTFILKSDQCGNTYTIANSIWRDYVDNIPKYLSKIISQIYEKLMELLTIQQEETFDIAEASVKLLASKFSDKFFMELLPMIKENIIAKKDNETVVDSSFYIIYTAVTEISEKLLNSFKDKILKIVNENLFTPFSSVRYRIAKIVYEISKKLSDNNLNRNLIFNVMKQARGKPYDEQKKILEIVAYLVKLSKGEIINYAISEIFRKPYEEGFLELGTMISSQISQYYNEAVEIKNLYSNLYEAFFMFPTRAVETIVAITEKLEEDSLPLFIEFLDRLQGRLENRKESERGENEKGEKALEYYYSEIISKFVSASQDDSLDDQLTEKIIMLLFFDNKELTVNVGYTLKLLVERTEKSPDVDVIVESLLKSLDSLIKKFNLGLTEEKTTEIMKEKIKLMMDNLLFTVQNGLLYGNEKLFSCDLITYIINFSSRQNLKPYIMKIVGPIIRILSEKINPLIKEKLMDNARMLIVKSKEDIKGISPQLQSVFLKTLTDSSVKNCERYQIKAGENIIRLLQYYPRADVTANDLLKSIQNKIDLHMGINAIFEMEILSDVIRFFGHALKPTTVVSQFNTVKDWIKDHQEIPFDSIISLLASYAPYVTPEVKSSPTFTNDLHKKLYVFLSAFDGDLKELEEKKDEILKIIKSLKKDQIIVLLKPLGKVVNKYRCYKELKEEKIDEILTKYELVIEEIFNTTDLITPTTELVDANICLLLLSLGYMKVYETNKELRTKVFRFIIALMELNKINPQLLVSCLSLLVLKEIKPTPDRSDILNEVGNITEDEKVFEIVDNFLKKIYLLFDK